MKIKDSDLASLRAACESVLAQHPRAAAEYAARGLSHKRFRWDVLRASGFNTVGLYWYLNDDHIDTALRAIMPEG